MFSLASGALNAVRGVNTGTVSITAAPQYSVEAACVQSCLYEPSLNQFYPDFLGELPNYLGCSSTGYNECYCTSDVQDEASLILSTCVDAGCVGTAQIGEAISVYNDYCVSAGYPRKNGNAVATTTNEGTTYTTTINGVPLTATVIDPGSTATGSSPGKSPSSSSSKSGSKVNIGLIVGAVLGGLALIAIILVIVLMMMRQRRRAKQEALGQPPPFQPPPMQQPPMQQPPVQITPVPRYSAPVSPMSGKVELDNKPMTTPVVTVQERANMNMSRVGNRLAPEVGANEWYNQQLQGDVHQLHGNSRPVGNPGVELPGNERY